MTELGASYSMVFAIKLATRLGMSPDEALSLPLAKAIAYNSALEVLDGTKNATAEISKEDKEIVKFLSDNQKEVVERLKNMRSFE